MSLYTYLNVTTFKSQSKSCLLVFDEMKSYFWVSLFLEVGDDGLADKLCVSHHVQNLTEIKNIFIHLVVIQTVFFYLKKIENEQD